LLMGKRTVISSNFKGFVKGLLITTNIK